MQDELAAFGNSLVIERLDACSVCAVHGDIVV
jgi:hypothetical protein